MLKNDRKKERGNRERESKKKRNLQMKESMKNWIKRMKKEREKTTNLQNENHKKQEL